MFNRFLVPSVLLATFLVSNAKPAMALDAYGNPFEEDGFVSQDWQVVCDNTLTCRAAGYTEQYDTSVSMLITAVPKVAIPTVEVLVLPDSKYTGDIDVELRLNGKSYGQLDKSTTEHIYKFNQEQTLELLQLANQYASIEFVMLEGDNKKSSSISDKGLMAVLLKLDDVQGRVGNPLALVIKNNSNRQTPKKLKPKPIISKAYSFPLKEGGRYVVARNGKYYRVPNDKRYTNHISDSQKQYWQKNMTSWVEPTLDQGDNECSFLNVDSNFYGVGNMKWTFTPINHQYTIASHQCWGGAYNFGYGLWVFENSKANQPELITLNGGHYEEGEITVAHKGRGVGDCWNYKAWVWNGKTFVKSSEAATGLCRGFSGGAWVLPTYVSEVIKNEQ